jgi:uncharacterized oxidoreductase
MPVFSSKALYAVSHLISRRMGSEEVEAHEVADHLMRANLAGHDSHGVGMLPAYVRLFIEGLLVVNQTPETVLDFGALLVLDARRGYGQRMAANAVRQAIGRARETGACVLALRNSAHIGRVGTYAELAAAHGMAFTAFVNVADHFDVQAPYACADARVGTNPFCTAVPGTDGGVAMMLDMATTTIAAGKARVAYNKGVPAPEGALIDADGNPTTDPTGLIRDHAGALVSFGKHKGSGLAIMAEVMTTAIAGGQRADAEQKGGILNSMLAVVIDTARLGGVETVAREAAATRAHIKSARVAPGFEEILLPGDPERRYTAERLRTGIEVDETTWSDIRAAAARIGITEAEIDAAVAG